MKATSALKYISCLILVCYLPFLIVLVYFLSGIGVLPAARAFSFFTCKPQFKITAFWQNNYGIIWGLHLLFSKWLSGIV